MKTIKCRDIVDGVCDEPISGATPEEIMKNQHAHVGGATDEAHKELMAQWQKGDQGEAGMKEWQAKFQKVWDATKED
jgi:hypothetical protein